MYKGVCESMYGERAGYREFVEITAVGKNFVGLGGGLEVGIFAEFLCTVPSTISASLKSECEVPMFFSSRCKVLLTFLFSLLVFFDEGVDSVDGMTSGGLDFSANSVFWAASWIMGVRDFERVTSWVPEVDPSTFLARFGFFYLLCELRTAFLLVRRIFGCRDLLGFCYLDYFFRVWITHHQVFGAFPRLSEDRIWVCDVTPSAPTLHQPLRTISLPSRRSTSGPDRGIAHFLTATRNTIEGVGEKRTNEQNEQYAWS